MRRLGNLAVLMLAVLPPSAASAAPPTLDKPGEKVRFLSLAEARANALEHEMNASTADTDCGLKKVLAERKPGSKRIVLTGIPHGARRAEYERNINQALLNIECAYWNLYGSYWQLHSREQGLRFAYETWKITQAQHRVGRVSQAAVAQAEGQYNLFRCQRLQAIENVLDNERQLRAMMGIAIQDGTRLVPSDAPTLVEKELDWEDGLHAALKHRPELRISRHDIKLAACDVEMAKEVAGADALDDGVRQAKLQLDRARLVRKDQELKAERFLALYYRRVSSAYAQIKAARAQREAFATQLRIRYELYRAGANEPGNGNPVTLNQLLEAQRFWAEALATEYQAIATYNNSLAGWEYAKGDIRKYAHVQIGDEPSASITGALRELKPHAPTLYILFDGRCMERAVDREHKRTEQHVRREPAVASGRGTTESGPSLPALWKYMPPLEDAGEVQTGLIQGPTLDLK